jgi:hypothetical protein
MAGIQWQLRDHGRDAEGLHGGGFPLHGEGQYSLRICLRVAGISPERGDCKIAGSEGRWSRQGCGGDTAREHSENFVPAGRRGIARHAPGLEDKRKCVCPESLADKRKGSRE